MLVKRGFNTQTRCFLFKRSLKTSVYYICLLQNGPISRFISVTDRDYGTYSGSSGKVTVQKSFTGKLLIKGRNDSLLLLNITAHREEKRTPVACAMQVIVSLTTIKI